MATDSAGVQACATHADWLGLFDDEERDRSQPRTFSLWLFGLKHTPKIIDSEAGIPKESAKCAFRNLRVIGNDQPSIGRLAVAKDDVATSLPIDSVAKPTKDFYQLPTG